jgi:hypothetical protein
MVAPDWTRMYNGKWRSGTIGMPADEIGVYIQICTFIGETGMRVPLDRPHAKLGLHHATFKKCIAALIAKGKVVKYGDGYGQPKAEKEYAFASQALGQRNHLEHPSDAEEAGHAGAGKARH